MTTNKKILKHSHDTYLKDLPVDAKYFFSIRNPISRFRSGFYSRKRKGQPRLYSKWSEHDQVAFSDFEHANDLAESLFEPGKLGERAWAAMKSIRHTSQNQSDWFDCRGNFLQVRPPIWIIRQEEFEQDLSSFWKRAEFNVDISEIEFEPDKVYAHANSYSGTPDLSDKAKKNLERWYVQDIIFYQLCSAWIEESSSSRGLLE